MRARSHGTRDGAEARRARHVRRPIEASRTLSAPSEVVLRFLSDLENHARLAPTSVSVLTLDQQDDLSTRALVRLRGPLAVHRTASTCLRRPTASSITGRAKIGTATVASVAWSIRTLGAGSVVTLCATVDAAGPLDAVLLRFGGRRWLAKRFDAALENLSLELSDDPARSDPDSPSDQQSWPGLTPGMASAHLGPGRLGLDHRLPVYNFRRRSGPPHRIE